MIKNIYRKEKYIPLTKFAIPKNVRKISNALLDHFLSIYENIFYRVLYWRWKMLLLQYFSRLPSNSCGKRHKIIEPRFVSFSIFLKRYLQGDQDKNSCILPPKEVISSKNILDYVSYHLYKCKIAFWCTFWSKNELKTMNNGWRDIFCFGTMREDLTFLNIFVFIQGW